MKDIEPILVRAFRRPFVKKILFYYGRYHRQKVKEELLTKIQRAKYDYLVTGLRYHFSFYQAGPYPTPWEARAFQIRFERTDDFYGQIQKNGKHVVKINVGPAYFFLSDSLFFR